MCKRQIVGVLLIITVLVLGACGSTTTTPSTTEISTKAPEDVISLAVPGFNFIEKSDRVEPLFSGEEYSALSFFTPKANSEFINKVDHLTVYVYLFKDEVSSQQHFNFLTGTGTSSMQTQINGINTIITYNANSGETLAIQRQGKLVIYSLSAPPFEATTFDESILKDSSIEGLKALR